MKSRTPQKSQDWELADPTPEELAELKRNLAAAEAATARGGGIPWEEAKRRLRARLARRRLTEEMRGGE